MKNIPRCLALATWIAASATMAPTAHATNPPRDGGNPFANAAFYIDANYAAQVESSAAASPSDAALLRKAAAYPTAVWLTSVGDVPTARRTLDAAAVQERRAGKPLVVAFALYDLPGRDCSAAASHGELAADDAGVRRYEAEFIDPIAAAIHAHPKTRVVVFVEPDSLANIATNLKVPACAQAEHAYRASIAYAIRTLALPNASIYVDAGHAGWLGWNGNRVAIAKVFAEVLADAGGADKIRGFVTNVSNYDSLDTGDLARLAPSDPAKGELSYVRLLDASLAAVGIAGKRFVVDTGRNGRAGLRTDPGSWCNVRGAGLGERPRANPDDLVDAYFWIKPPGQSDGGSDPGGAGFDPQCGGPHAADSAGGAPPAGQWFHAYFVALAKNASPPL
ncbi:MAG TPA: glycoside hydrolase family 6 protein [Polyangiaceae bacterium]|jgi:cellulose 1,4-beta-cellobiosidase